MVGRLKNQQLVSDLDGNSNKIINLTDPTAAQDAATKAYVDGATGDGLFDAVVAPSGGDYSTVKAAVDAGHTDILVKGGTVTETANTSTTNDVWIHVRPDSIWDLSTFTFTVTGNNSVLMLSGEEGYYRTGRTGSQITCAPASGNTFAIESLGTAFNARDISFRNTVSTGRIARCEEIRLNNVLIECPGNDSGFNGMQRLIINDSRIEGTSAAYNVLNSPELYINGLLIGGNFSTLVGQYLFSPTNELSVISNISTDSSFSFQASGFVSNISVDGDEDVNIVTNNLSSMSNVTCNNLDATSGANYMLTNCIVGGDFTSSTGNNDIEITGCRFQSSVTLSSNHMLLSNCIFLIGLTVEGDFCMISNSRAGSKTGGGANTITINATADSTKLTSVMVDSAVVDNGTDTSFVGVTVY